MGEAFAELARGGPLLLALGAAALAGLVSFLSPCILPLVPGYLSYVTGLAGAGLDASGPGTPVAQSGTPAAAAAADRAGGGGAGGTAVAVQTPVQAPAPTPTRAASDADRRAGKGRVLAGTALFIVGFTVVFSLSAILFATVGNALFAHRRAVEIGAGLLVVVLGLAFLGLVPGMQREFRIQRLPSAGLLGAPVFGAVFALSWTPCVGPTLGAVLSMATISGKTDRALMLAIAYCLGLGIPFMIFGLAFERLLGVFKAIRRNSRWVTRVGGALLVLVGLALVSGGWGDFTIWLKTNVGVGETGI